MLKSKWLQVHCDVPPKDALRLLLQVRFNADTGSGFDPISRETGFLHCRYIERVTTTEKMVDPFGDTSELQMVRYSITVFRMHHLDSSGVYHLEISNPARTVRPLISALSSALDGITVVEPEWPVLELFRVLKKASPRARVVRLRACGIPISETTVSKVDLTSSENAMADFRTVFPRSLEKIDRIRIDRPFIDLVGALELSVNGICGFEENAEHLVRDLILGTATKQLKS